jgi:hypothetical protein
MHIYRILNSFKLVYGNALIIGHEGQGKKTLVELICEI